MRIIGIDIQNFRKLFGCHIDISKETTLFVGANNSGKTSAMDALAKFLANRSFVFNDITIWEAPNRKTNCRYGIEVTQTTFAGVSVLSSIYSRILRNSSANLKRMLILPFS